MVTMKLDDPRGEGEGKGRGRGAGGGPLAPLEKVSPLYTRASPRTGILAYSLSPIIMAGKVSAVLMLIK